MTCDQVLLSSDKDAKSLLNKNKESVVTLEISAAAQGLDNEYDERKVRHILETD